MKIGITYDLKTAGAKTAGVRDDEDEEFDSPHTIEAIANVLRGLGHAVTLLGDGREFLEKFLVEKPDFVFNFAEGRGVSRSREARVPAVLEMLGIPFTGSDPFTMAVTLDKDCAKKLVAAAGVAVPAGFALAPRMATATIPLDALRFPLVVKPAWEGSSKGIRNRCFVKDARSLAGVVDSLRQTHRQTVLLEEYIAGDEVTVGLIGNAPPTILGMMRIVPNTPGDHFIYSLEIKREFRKLVTYECPPPLPASTLDAIAASSQTVFGALACRDVSRIDFRVRDGVPYFLEVNPLPGLHPEDSDLVIMAKIIGWTYERLVTSIVDAALKRCGLA
ncbi:MAG: D-alanine--D-alanine ligase [Planctomycetes bacterium]|nr:D-alanine--D-alanine ligase [Planctomycetota bacterium]